MKRFLFFIPLLVIVGFFLFWRGTSFTIFKKNIALNNLDIQNPPAGFLSGKPCDNATNRPFGVMLASDPEARPLSGIGQADMVIEMPISVDGITRLMALFQCQEPDDIGSIRSARQPFIGIAKGYDAIFVHWGGEHGALKMLNTEVIDNLDALNDPNQAFYRKKDIPAPHNGFTSFSSLKGTAQKLGYARNLSHELEKNPPLEFKKEDASMPLASFAPEVTISYRKGFEVAYHYDENTASYIRERAGLAEIDALTKNPIRAKNILILFAKIYPTYSQYVNVEIDGKRGNLKAFISGKEIDGFWEKNSVDAPLEFYSAQGTHLALAPGTTWIEVVDQTLHEKNTS